MACVVRCYTLQLCLKILILPSLKCYSLYLFTVTPMDGESDRAVESDTNINCTRFLFKNINTYVNTFILLVFYIIVECLYFFSTLIFNTNVSDTIYICVRLHYPVQFTVHRCKYPSKQGPNLFQSTCTSCNAIRNTSSVLESCIIYEETTTKGKVISGSASL